ncbi:uncharacterized protein YidB (DUF937 family) [Neobacillus sp. B4I6]|uniref:VgrG-related protein n=1 Tax=Neobacillus sp. B4I6 TaxID=3373925 RepID=UPI003D1D4DCC
MESGSPGSTPSSSGYGSTPSSSSGLGSLSSKYESGGAGAGTIGRNSGDWGGASYGTYQIATNTGTMKTFMKYLKSANPSMYQALARSSPGSSSFDQTWKALAKNYGKEFNNVQHGFIKKSHYDPAASKVLKSTGIDVNRYSSALQNVLWSVSVQHGSGGASKVFRNAGIRKGMSEAEIIKRVYAERMANGGRKYFSRSSPSIRNSVVRRFKNELRDALNMLG